MATKRKSKQSEETRFLTAKEAESFRNAIDRARRKAWKASENKHYHDFIRREMKSIEKKLQKVLLDIPTARMSNYSYR